MKKILFVGVLALFATMFGSAVANADDNVYQSHQVDVKAEFPGGDKEMYAFLGNTVKYPEEFKAAGISGKVIVQAIINEDGTITEVRVLRNLTNEQAFADAFIAGIKALPKWKPAEKGGNKVKMFYMMSMSFAMKK